MKTVGSHEARTHLSRFLDQVEKGERIMITRHGRPVAVLVPIEATPVTAVDEVMERMRRLRTGNRLGGLSIRQLIDQGRRY